MTSQIKKYFPLVSQDKFYLEINNALKSLEQLHKKILDKGSLLNQTTDDYTIPDDILLVRPAEKKTLYSTTINSVVGPGSALVSYKMYGVGFLGSYFNYSAISRARKNLKQGLITFKLFKEITLQNTDTKKL